MSAPFLEARAVGKQYGHVIALRGVSIAVEAGSVTCVLGDNGAGKSTLIKILSGVHQHDDGELLVDGQPVRLGSPREALDEPTSALGVKQAGMVLRYIAQARARGLGVVFITHNPHHAYPIGDRFLILNRGRSIGNFHRSEIASDELVRLMAGGAELEQLSQELQRPVP